MQPQDKTKLLAHLAMLSAVTVVLSWVDSLIPVSGALPGAKLGLANLAVLAGLYLLGPKWGSVICLMKILLATVLFGNAYSFFYSFAGGLLSYLMMLSLKKRCSMTFVSVCGGLAHNLGQLLVAAAVLETLGLLSYFPVLALCGLGAGMAIGVVGGILIRRITPHLNL